MKSSVLGRIAIYALLLLGTIVFAWAVSLDGRNDSETRSRALHRKSPAARAADSATTFALRGRSPFRRGKRRTNGGSDVGHRATTGQRELSVAGRCRSRRPAKTNGARHLPKNGQHPAAETWKLPNEQFGVAIIAAVNPELIRETAMQLRRVFCLGSLLARSYDLQEDKLIDPAKAAAAWQVSGDAKAELIQSGSADEAFAELDYDFSHGDSVVLTQTFTTSFPVDRLHRIQLSLRTDDTWHALDFFLEKNGTRYHAERKLESSDNNWIVYTWQERGPDDQPTKIRTWNLLLPDGTSAVNSPNELKITLELHRVSQLEAWWEKIRRNYRLTLDYIPFWRTWARAFFSSSSIWSAHS